MTTINWGLLQNVDIGGAFQAGAERGRAQRVDHETRNAFAAYMQNPTDPAPVNALAKWNPDAAMQLRGMQQKDHARLVAGRAAGGDTTAMAELQTIDPAAWAGLDKANREKAKAGIDFIAQAGQHILTAPVSERAALWENYIDRGIAMGHPEFAQYRGKYDEGTLRAAIAEAGQIKSFLDGQKPDYMAVPEGGALVNTRDPAALQRFGGASTTPPPPPSGFQIDGGPASAPGGFPAR